MKIHRALGNGGYSATSSASSENPPKFYPADDVKKPLVNKHKPIITKLRSGIAPGAVLIILSGRLKGKRVVFQFMLLVTSVPCEIMVLTGVKPVNKVPCCCV
ncbi:60S ribosomal protein L6 [Tripterygium wilfordii]|uniref:60S ribosomal protein L6 n=1 Tax=Tripterygium wilfordii TaxID=458696 RepID=A0A7J7DDP6_TRIWF|nr:60S ribosomal protein L6 [Tripterygium wilfordii]